MTTLAEIVKYINALLEPSHFKDRAYNGLQVESSSQEISHIAYAVDAGLSIVEKTIQEKAQLLIVHHGIYWGKESPLIGPLAKKIALLLKCGCSLYASHLPLDAHSEVGNNFELGRFFNLKNLTPFCEHDGSMIGAKGFCDKPKKMIELVERAKFLPGAKEPLVFNFGNEYINTVALVSGSATFALSPAAEEGLDLLISGEPRHEAYHLAKELKMNAIFAGHYATEVFGVRALAKRLEKDFGVSSVFIDEPTGI